MTIPVPQTNFTRGEISPQLYRRVDTKAYQSGAKRLLNCYLRSQGGVLPRPGSERLASLRLEKPRLARFRFNKEQRYMFAFYSGFVDIYSEGGVLLETLAGPWLQHTLDDLSFTQTLDSMFITHEDFWGQRILRVSASNFTIGDMEFESSGLITYEPFYKHADDTITLDPSATTGNINIVVNASGTDYFDGGYINRNLKLKGKQVLITGITDSNTITATVLETLVDALETADWEEQAWSQRYGYSRLISFHDRRLLLAGHKSAPDLFFASKPNAFFNFDTGTGADGDAIATVIGGEDLSEFRGILSSRHLQVFTSHGAFYVPQTDARPFSAANIAFRQQVDFPSEQIKPVSMDGATLYVEDNSSTIREFIFVDTEQAYVADDVSLLSGHLVKSPVDMQYVASSGLNKYFMTILNADGTMAQYQSLRSEEVSGWAPWEFDGQVLAIQSMDEKLFLAVKRTIEGVLYHFLEVLHFEPEWTLDCARRITVGTALNVFPDLMDYAGMTVDVIADMKYQGKITVSTSGELTLPNDETAVDVIIGFQYIIDIQPLPPHVETTGGSQHGRKRRISGVLAHVANCYGLKVGKENLPLYNQFNDVSLPIEPFTGNYYFGLSTEYERDPTVPITRPEPLPFELLGLSIDVE